MATPQAVQLFIPCLVDQLYPEIGIATANILTHFGYELRYTPEIVCCGQPAFNAGHRDESQKVASVCLSTLDQDKDCYAIVCPSGSCAAMVKKFYGMLFDDPARQEAAKRVAAKTFELAEFLMREGHAKSSSKSAPKGGEVLGFHNSCHSYRELRLKTEGREVLARITGCSISEPQEEPSCCGFGGLFSVKFPAIAAGMAKTRLEKFADAKVSRIASNDPGCIMHLRSEATRHGIPAEVEHIAIPIAKALSLPIDTFRASKSTSREGEANRGR